MTRRPADLFDRAHDWDALDAFVTEPGPGLRIAVVHGRRRQGKSYLLRRLAAVHRGLYHQALEEEAAPALARLGMAVGAYLGVPGGRLAFGSWEEATTALTEMRRPDGKPQLVVVDEYPYLSERVGELSSLLQLAVDASRAAPGAPVRLVLCGSAMSVMTDLLSGQRSLRGRVATEVRMSPFDFRDAASYWGVTANWRVALWLDAIVGGTPGYRDLMSAAPPKSIADVGRWLADGVCNPASALFREDDYLLAEERGLTDRSLYHSVLSAVANGASTETRMAEVLGRGRQALAWPLKVLREGGFVVRDEDALRQRRPTYRVADPIVRFHHVVTRPDLARFEDRRTREAWSDAADRFATHVLGPHFEELARRWTARWASPETTAGGVAVVGPTQVADRRARSRVEVDVVGLASPGRRRYRVRVIGEAKAASKPMGEGALSRLERARDLLAERGDVDVRGSKLLLFCAGGFSPALRRAASGRDEVELVDLERLYEGG